MGGSLGSGQVEYHTDRPLIHFASPEGEVTRALLAHRLRQHDFEIAERVPNGNQEY